MPERFAVYRYQIERPGEAPEARYSLEPMGGTRYAGRDGQTRKHEPEESSAMQPAGHVEAPTGTQVATVEPPTLDIPGRGKVDLHAIIGATDGGTSELADLVSWHPAGRHPG